MKGLTMKKLTSFVKTNLIPSRNLYKLEYWLAPYEIGYFIKYYTTKSILHNVEDNIRRYYSRLLCDEKITKKIYKFVNNDNKLTNIDVRDEFIKIILKELKKDIK